MRIASKRENRVLFLVGFVLGCLCFLFVYGTDVLRFSYDGWIFHGDTDLRQHYLGWCHYRLSSWKFPLGMIDSLSYPTSVSVLWTDSIPLFAIFFKLLNGVLPKTFQYFGLFGILSFGLQGGMAAILLRKATDRIPVCIAMCIPFILSYPIIQRTFYHTSLAAQWIILLAIWLWMSDIQKKSQKKQMLVWGSFAVLCVFIHSYFLPMVACIMCGSLLEDILQGGKIRKSLAVIGSFIICGVVSLYILGAFAGGVAASYGIGQFEMNLNSFLNPLGHSRLLPELAMHFDTQYEGFAYLGAGMLLLALIFTVIVLAGVWKKRSSMEKGKEFFRAHARKLSYLTVFVIFLLVSVCPNISLGSTLLVRIPYPRFVNTITGIFRSNGRFAWPMIYLLLFAATYLLRQKLSARIFSIVMMACVVLQVLDLSCYVEEKRAIYHVEEQQYSSIWDVEALNQRIDEYHRFILFDNSNDLLMTTAYYTYLHDMTMNRFYYARDIDKQVEENLKPYELELLEQRPESDCLYVFAPKEYKKYGNSGLHFYKVQDWVVGSLEEIPDMKEVKPKQKKK